LEMPMASLTKLMTALIIVDNHAMDEKVRVPADIEDVEGNSVHLPAGDTFTVGDLLSALLIKSSNDAAVTLARFHSGSESEFAKVMNARAQVLGLNDTHYDNASGLDSRRQTSTPRDVALLGTFVMRIPEIALRMSTASETITSLEGRSMSLSHTNNLVHGSESSVIAGKTGTTDGAGQCLLSIVEDEGRKYVVVLLRSANRYGDMSRILPVLPE
jgi:D-alanyl-D-alanine carboxypeptidase